MNKLTALLTTLYIAVGDRIDDERGEGPVYSSIMIAGMAAAGVTIIGIVVAAVARHMGSL